MHEGFKRLGENVEDEKTMTGFQKCLHKNEHIFIGFMWTSEVLSDLASFPSSPQHNPTLNMSQTLTFRLSNSMDQIFWSGFKYSPVTDLNFFSS